MNMIKHTRVWARTLCLAASLSLASMAQAAVVNMVFDDFESGLSKWDVRGLLIPHARIVTDPLNAGNKVLSFDVPFAAGSIFSKDFVNSTGSYTLSWDYLGRARTFSTAGDLGGYIGVSSANTLAQLWVGGTGSYATPVDLIDDGQWHSYSRTFTAPAALGSTIRLMMEDWIGSGFVTRDAFFDNVTLRDSSVAAPNTRIPEPGSLFLVGLAMAAGAVVSRRRPAGGQA